jgi:hypothetical protein
MLGLLLVLIGLDVAASTDIRELLADIVRPNRSNRPSKPGIE